MFPPGHFHSPIPDMDEVRRDDALLFGPPPASIPGIDMREAEQLALLQQFAKLYPDIPFGDEPRPGLRYHYLNPAYSFSDAIMLHCMLRTLRPRPSTEVLGAFNGDGNFGRLWNGAEFVADVSDVRYWADGLAIDASTGNLDRALGFASVDQAWQAISGNGNFFGTTLASGGRFNPQERMA